jgi:flagellar basal body rod protein FlgG
MTLHGILNSAHGLNYFSRRQEVMANNLANVETDAFKSDYMSAMRAQGSDAPSPVEAMDLTQGTINQTGRPLDLALEGPGFMVLQTPAGERLSRGGSLALDGANRLSDRHGNPVLGEQGPIAVPIGHSSLEVKADGTVLADGVELGRLRIESVTDPKALTKEGAGLFIAAGPTTPVPVEGVQVRQGSVEESNMKPVEGMMDLVMIQRAYTANVEALKAMDSVLGNVVNEVGKS